MNTATKWTLGVIWLLWTAGWGAGAFAFFHFAAQPIDVSGGVEGPLEAGPVVTAPVSGKKGVAVSTTLWGLGYAEDSQGRYTTYTTVYQSLLGGLRVGDVSLTMEEWKAHRDPSKIVEPYTQMKTVPPQLTVKEDGNTYAGYALEEIVFHPGEQVFIKDKRVYRGTRAERFAFLESEARAGRFAGWAFVLVASLPSLIFALVRLRRAS